MTAAAVTRVAPPERERTSARVRGTLATAGAAVLGAAPHVLHHVGPLAGAALLAGTTGKLLFGALGFVLALPMLRSLHNRHRSWLVPAGVLAAMVAAFSLSTLVIGPRLTGSGSAPDTKPVPGKTAPARPDGMSQSEHEAHHH